MLSASIVTYHTPSDELARCIQCLDTPSVDRITIIDNSSSDNTKALAEKRNITYIPSRNIGYGAAHNIAIRKSMDDGYDYHLVLNSDIQFDSEIIARMLDYMDANPEVAALHPDVRNPEGTRQYTARRLPSPIDVFGRRFLPDSWMKRRNRRYLLMDADLTKPLDVPYFQGSFMLLRVSALRESGIFDERFFMYPEDIDLIRRLHSKGKTLYWPRVKVMHAHRAGSYRSLKLLIIHAVNMCRYFSKWGWWNDAERDKFNARLDSAVTESARTAKKD